MYLSSNDKNTIHNFFSTRTTYDVDFFLNGKSDDQIYNIYNRIKDALVRYPNEIAFYLDSHPEAQPRYTLEELQKMTYNKLSELREKFKIRKGKKVTGTTIQNKAYEDALNVIKSKSTAELCVDLITQATESELILSSSEVNKIYGKDWDMDFLEEHGIVLEDAMTHLKSETDPEQVRLDKIDEIISSGLLINGQKPTFEQLYSFNSRQLNRAYKLVKETKLPKTK